MQTFKAEFKKIITIRSTYVIMLVFFLLTTAIAFYVHGYKHSSDVIAGGTKSSVFIASSATQIATTLSIAGAIIALLLVAHEYRHNIIVYTLTASNSRTKVLFSKIAAIMTFVFIFSLLAGIISLSVVYAGVALSHQTLVHQDINFVNLFAKVIFFCEAYALAGMLFALLIRNQVGAIAALFVLPGTVETLLSLLLKHNSVYLPFTALGEVVLPPDTAPPKMNTLGYLTPAHGALVFTAWIVGGYLVAWYLFVRRDAN